MRAPLRESLRERLAADELHRDEVQAGVAVDLVDRDDVRMVEGGRRLGFAGEAFAAEGVGEPFGEDLQGDVAIEAGVAGAPDDAHAAFSGLFDDQVLL